MEATNIPEDYFLGCLHLTDYNSLVIGEQKRLLVEKKIYVQNHDKFEIIYIDKSLNLKKQDDKINFGESFVFNEIDYKINELFLKELYLYVEQDVHASMLMHIEIKTKEISLHAKHIENFGDIKAFYKEQYKKQYHKIVENEYFFMFNEPEAWKYPDWEYFVTEEIRFCSSLIEMHLFSEFGYSCFEDISLKWQDLYYYSEVMNFLKQKLNETNNTTLSKLIFKENGEEIFNHIVLSYQEDKNQAFFNYLYYFLKDELQKLKLEDEHSNTYTSYVVKKGLLKNYGRMKKSVSSSKKRHCTMMNLFNEMYSQKFE